MLMSYIHATAKSSFDNSFNEMIGDANLYFIRKSYGPPNPLTSNNRPLHSFNNSKKIIVYFQQLIRKESRLKNMLTERIKQIKIRLVKINKRQSYFIRNSFFVSVFFFHRKIIMLFIIQDVRSPSFLFKRLFFFIIIIYLVLCLSAFSLALKLQFSNDSHLT